MVLALTGSPPNSAVMVNTAVNTELAANWAPLALAAGAPLRNYVMNGQFNVTQRGTGPWTASSYTADRWNFQVNGDTASASIVTLADADRAAIGDEAAEYGLQFAVTGASTAANYTQFFQNIEDVRRLSNKTVTLSFWAKTSVALSLGMRAYQSFGTGGSPSTQVTQAAQVSALTTSWARYSLTFTLGSASGKTLGTNGDHCSGVVFELSSGTTNAAAYGVGAQSGTFTFWGMQLEIGSTATALEKRPAGFELALCQRYYQTGGWSWGGYVGTYGFAMTVGLPVQMRISPTCTNATSSAANLSTVTTVNVPGSTSQVQVYASGGATGVASGYGTFTASADL